MSMLITLYCTTYKFWIESFSSTNSFFVSTNYKLNQTINMWPSIIIIHWHTSVLVSVISIITVWSISFYKKCNNDYTNISVIVVPLGLGLAVSDLTGLFRVAGTISCGKSRYSRRYWIPLNEWIRWLLPGIKMVWFDLLTIIIVSTVIGNNIIGH